MTNYHRVRRKVFNPSSKNFAAKKFAARMATPLPLGPAEICDG